MGTANRLRDECAVKRHTPTACLRRWGGMRGPFTENGGLAGRLTSYLDPGRLVIIPTVSIPEDLMASITSMTRP